jgi:2-hydroxy-3-keto-5-methylthiopentenyl-1-phosphate phosphatase
MKEPRPRPGLLCFGAMTLAIDTFGKKAAMVFDFDGTITEEDIFDGVFTRFADPKCWEAHRAYHDREISMKEAYLAMAEYFRGSAEEVADFVVSFARLRPGFRKLLSGLSGRGIRTMIVSNGFDLYLRLLLDRWGIRLAEEDIFCHRARIVDNRFIPSFREHRNLRHHNCLIGKAEIIRELQVEGYYVIFAGNGWSDAPAGRVADLVFARERLADYCREENLPCVPFTDFFQVSDYLFG